MRSVTARFRELKVLRGLLLLVFNLVGVFVWVSLWSSRASVVLLVLFGIAMLAVNVFMILLLLSAARQKTPLLKEHLRFPHNPFFEELWSEKQEFFSILGLDLRVVQKDEWAYTVGGMIYRSFIVEGAFAYSESRGDISEEAFERIVETGTHISDCMGWSDKITVNNTLYTGKVDKYAARRTRQILAEKLQRGERETAYLVASDFIRISFAITQKALPQAYSTWRVFNSVESAFRAVLEGHFMTEQIPSEFQKIARSVELPSISRKDIHQERIDQMYTILARIESSDVDNIPMPHIPPDDMYADIFKALEMVLEDKRLQIQKAQAQAEELERQAAEIQLANSKLEEQNRELEEQSITIQLANTKLSEQNAALSALNMEKNEIMGIVTHDLKNPIGAVRTFADMIVEGYVRQEDITNVAGKILDTTDKMIELVTNLLDLNRMEQGAIQYKMISASLHSLLDSLMFEYHINAEKKAITLELRKIGEDFPVLVDEQAIMQVMDNLVSNALKFSPFGTNVIIRILSKEKIMRVEIQDEGPGISPEDMKKLFGKFARLSAQPTGGEHSTGLGLSIVKKMVEAMNGKVWCESEAGNGATFIVELPAHP